MNYALAYEQLVQKAKDRTVVPSAIERHHILPKSMGGNNAKENIVFLTPREHYIAHHLLWKIHKNISMRRAFWCMMVIKNNNRKYKVNSKTYEILRVAQANEMRVLRAGVKDSDETRAKKSKSHTGLKRGISPLRGKPMPFNNKWFITCPHCDKTGIEWNMKRYHFDNCIEINPGRIIESKSKGITLTKHKCPFCKIETSMGNLKRWHLDKCKENISVH